MIPKNLVLEDERVRLEPLDFQHAPELFEAGNDDEIFRKTGRKNPISSLIATQRYIGEALYGATPSGIPFAIIDKTTARAIGATRYFDISVTDRKLEIGWTWLGRHYWRTHVNTSCKYLLLRYAFEEAHAIRVQFKADSENDRSRSALERIGAEYEGTWRHARIIEGVVRSQSYYSILASEWPAVKSQLQTLRLRYAQGHRAACTP